MEVADSGGKKESDHIVKKGGEEIEKLIGNRILHGGKKDLGKMKMNRQAG